MKNILIAIVTNSIFSSLIFIYLIYKTKIKRRFLYTDNLIIIILATLIGRSVVNEFSVHNVIHVVLLNLICAIILIVCLILLRFYRDPERHHNANETDILSPADGFIVYIKKIDKNSIPFSLKGKTILKLKELTKVDILRSPCCLMGIVMTMFDVHVNRAPTYGRVVLNEYFKGKFLSLKHGESEVENERNTTVMMNEYGRVGVIMIASKRVRGIETFVRTGENLEMGQRIGKIKFGSQTDVIFPAETEIKVKIGQWVYAGKTIIATFKSL